MEILTTENFAEKTKEGVVLVDFFADWCGPCKMLAPVLEKLAAEYEGKAKIVKVNVDNDTALARQFGVVSIPNMFVLKDGQVVDSLLGYNSANAIKALIDKAL
ncbi:MAG: thioredoxin [Erysipelotrichaceae bacterium]|nr:thioredoxin [Erysipelotrichaceae bacterium]